MVNDVENTQEVNLEGDAEDVEDSPSSLRLKLCNFPRFLKYPQVKQFLDRLVIIDANLSVSNLKPMAWRKLKAVPGTAYFSMTNESDLARAIELLNKKDFKGRNLILKRVADEPEIKPKTEEKQGKLLSAVDITTPLACIPYEEQLKQKEEETKETVQTLIRQLKSAGASGARYLRAESLVKPIVSSPVLKNYRNKCEFTVGRDSSGKPCVGFVSGRMADREVVIVPPYESGILTENMKHIVKMFTNYVETSGLEPFDEFKRSGFWKMITVRDFVGDCMIIFTAHPLDDQEKLKKAKDELVQLFINFGDVTRDITSRVTSIYWQEIENASDAVVYEHLAGVPYVYESVLDVRFRVSPATFFQTNSRGAELLYTEIGNALRLPKCEYFKQLPSIVQNGETVKCEAPESKKEEDNNSNPEKPLIILDICCGAGTIGQCLLRRVQRSANGLTGECLCVGVELVEQAVRDARVNAIDNGFNEETCRYVSGQAEVIFPTLHQHLPRTIALEKSRVVGVLDPPRAGISSKVIISCRKLEALNDLVYVSCDPRAALKNVVDLCRPESKKYEGEPFQVKSIQPVDLFPQTSHYEWVILLNR